jgi:uncharacterized protein YndB with AHSA1/START domain
MDMGTYQLIGERPSVRFERVYQHSIEETWSAVTTQERLGRWFPSKVEFEPSAGGSICFSGDPNVPDSAGVVLQFDPPRLFFFSWGKNELRFELAEVDESHIRFVLIDFLSVGNEAARNAAGWDVCLAALDAAISGHAADIDFVSVDWHERYDAYVAAGLPSGAPFPG